MEDLIQSKRGRPKTKVIIPKKQRDPINCKWCETPFIPRSIGNIFCSHECAKESVLNERERRERARFTIFERDQFKCVYCGRSSIEHGVLLVADHVMPSSKGGDNSLYNLVTCCFECNMRKADLILEESVYQRIVERNKQLIGQISPMRQMFVERVIWEIKNGKRSYS